MSWRTIWDDLYPEEADDPHDDASAAEMHRLRGLVMAQGAEIETVLGTIVRRLNPSAEIERRTAGQLLKDIRRLSGPAATAEWAENLLRIDTAVRRRNHAVHSPVTIGSSWWPYATGGGEWVPVMSLMNDGLYDEADLRSDLALQQGATVAAVQLLHSLEETI